MTSTTAPPGYWPARLALLSVRAALPERAHLDHDAFLLGPSGPCVTADTAARSLLTLPKPVYCAAQVRDRAVYIESGPLAASPLPPSHIRRVNYIGQMVRERFTGSNQYNVIWIGREEQLVVSLVDIEEFYRDYDCGPYQGAGADWVDSMFARSHHITPDSARGAVAICKVFPVNTGFRGFNFRLPRWLVRFIVPKRMQPPVPRRDA